VKLGHIYLIVVSSSLFHTSENCASSQCKFEYIHSLGGIGLPIPMSEFLWWNIVTRILVWKWESRSWER